MISRYIADRQHYFPTNIIMAGKFEIKANPQ
ncbi:hypothetical protein KL86PLE_100693 [uncultured Pleomorphomonas sp.]|uniref:Uncharacterized protein n=1 Tax=uncultured Pleomorphomonas sp. TaxID=442121 RepID=A0A212L5J9_9HYPH|nr:hypothetical protein KL86PLE_100693 [uncultured Pleomorphomonas sp.]